MEIVIALLCLLVAVSFIWRRYRISYFSRLGIPGPKPSLIFGNILELYSKGPLKCHEEWVRKYGRILGFYYGMKPVLLVADPELLKNILIKDFNKFINREPFVPIVRYSRQDPHAQSVLNLEGQDWKDVRSVLTPTFTAAKMKQMSGSIGDSIDQLVQLVGKEADSGKTLDLHDRFQRLTMDIISRTAFGIRTHVQETPKSKLMVAVSIMFRTPYKNIFILIGLCFPWLRLVCLRIMVFLGRLNNSGIKPRDFLLQGIRAVIKQRRQDPQARKQDLLQIMLEASVETDSGGKDDTSNLEAGHADYENATPQPPHEKKGKSVKKLSEDEIVNSSLTVLLAGYETTSTALSFTSYLLAKHPDIQDKLYEEINELTKTGEKLEYATINKLQYLDRVINESMRMYPPVILFITRFALEDVNYDSVKIPKGLLIQVPTYLLHNDPEFWAEPDKFDPDRFAEKTNSNGITYLPFGVGPRNCLGMRFAQLEAKLALAHLVHNFKIVLCDQQKEKFEAGIRLRTLTPKTGVLVTVESRNGSSPS